MAEAGWLEKCPPQLTILVRVPNDGGKSGWNFIGQVLRFSMDPKETIGQLKVILRSYLKIPEEKIELKTHDANVMEDKLPLGYYHTSADNMLELNMKEKKKEERGIIPVTSTD